MIPSLPFILATAFSTYVIHFCYRLYLHRRFFRDLPGPPHHWLLGHIPILAKTAVLFPPDCHPQLYLTTIAEKYNLEGLFYIDLWPISAAQCILLDANLQDEITVRRPLQMHQMAEEFLAPMLGKGVVSSLNGEAWKKLHSAMSPAFAWGHVRSLVPVLLEEVKHFRAKLDHYVESGEKFSMENLSSRLVFDVVGRIVFNERLDAQGDGGSQILSDSKEMIKLAQAGLSMNPVVKMKASWRRRVVLRTLNPALEARVMERYERLMQEGKIPSRKAKEAESVLDLMLREQLQHDQQNDSDKSAPGVSRELMVSLTTNIKGLLAGGHGTTTDTLCFAYVLLSKNPKVVKTLKDEHESVFGTGDFATIEEMLAKEPGKLGELPYTTAVINETLRLFPVGFGVRVAADGMVVKHDGESYPLTHPNHGGKNKMVVIPLGHYVHYSAKYFEDTAVFKPERWLEGDGVPRSYFRTFGRGPRACLGQTLAMDEMRVVLLATAGQYDFEYITDDVMAPMAGTKAKSVSWTSLDEEYGSVVWQELGLEAKPRGEVSMRVRKIDKPEHGT